jgi:hypothetical protein
VLKPCWQSQGKLTQLCQGTITETIGTQLVLLGTQIWTFVFSGSHTQDPPPCNGGCRAMSSATCRLEASARTGSAVAMLILYGPD